MAKQRILHEHPFEPVIDEQSQILVLGSIPSVVSVQQGYYYAHPTNRFYQVLSLLFHEDFVSPPWAKKRQMLLDQGIALYDALVAGTLDGSSDASIHKSEVVSLETFLQGSSIRHIYCNGQAAYRSIVQAYPLFPIPITQLPSTSAANATWSLEQLVEAWKVILPAE
jgi:hypoxanthine-DNA glycosylase